MTDTQVITPILTVLITAPIASWITYHFGVLNKRKDLRLQFLIDAYRRLENASCIEDRTPDRTTKLEEAIADVQLFGSIDQIRLIQEFAIKIKQKHHLELNDLLANLRKDLRRELCLDEIKGELSQLSFIRFNK